MQSLPPFPSIIMKKRSGREKHADPYLCYLCNRLIGATVLCCVCHTVSVHRKCGAVMGSQWTCATCSSKSEGEVVKEESDSESEQSKQIKAEPVLVARQTTAMPLLPGMTCFSVPRERLQPDTVFKQVIEESKSDAALLALLLQKQTEFQDLFSSFEGRKLELHSAKLGDQEHRMALFRLQEMHLQAQARLKSELIDRLQAARLFGFEGIKHLKGDSTVSDPPFQEIEAYHLSQKTVVERLLTGDFRQSPQKGNFVVRKSEPLRKKQQKKEVSTMASVLLNPASQGSAFALLAKAIGEIKKRNTDKEEDELTLSMLSAIVKGAFDSRVATFPGYLGTDPELLQELLVKIKHKY